MNSIAVIPKITVPLALKDKWEQQIIKTRSRTFKIVIYGRRHIMREDIEKAVYEHCEKSQIESLYTTVNPKEYFIVCKTEDTYEHFLNKTLNVNGVSVKPVAYDCMNIDARIHWLQEEVPDEMLAFFLEEHCDEVTSIRHETDENDVKSGVRIANIKLLNSQRNTFPHILLLTPSDPILITIPGRAPLCLRCHRIGHVRSQCNAPYCRHCNSFGHSSEDCRPTYANAARKNKRPTNSEKEDTDTDSTTTEDSLFNTVKEANAKDTQEWQTITRKKKKKKIQVNSTRNINTSTISHTTETEKPTEKTTPMSQTETDSEDSMNEEEEEEPTPTSLSSQPTPTSLTSQPTPTSLPSQSPT